jgi:hypothetical protein
MAGSFAKEVANIRVLGQKFGQKFTFYPNTNDVFEPGAARFGPG